MCYCKPHPRAINCTLMQIWSRSVMIMISARIALSHNSLFGHRNVLWNASINTKQNECIGNRRLSLCPSCFPQDVALMVCKCYTLTASIISLNSAKNALFFPTDTEVTHKPLFHTRLLHPTDAASAKTNICSSVLLTAHRTDKMKVITTIQLANRTQQSIS